MGAKHTDGPWEVTGPDDEPYGDITVGLKGRAVCRLWQDDAPEHSYNAEQWANARLIAACPTRDDILRRIVEMDKEGFSMRDYDGAKHPGWHVLMGEIEATLRYTEGA